MHFKVATVYITSEYDVQKERSDIENYFNNFDFNPIQSAIGAKLEELRQEYNDLDDAWGIHIQAKSNIDTV